MKRKTKLESDAVNHGNNFAIRHTMTNSSSKQQQLQQQQYNNTLHISRQVYTNTHSYVVQQLTV